jgi:hypothetical protein
LWHLHQEQVRRGPALLLLPLLHLLRLHSDPPEPLPVQLLLDRVHCWAAHVMNPQQQQQQVGLLLS